MQVVGWGECRQILHGGVDRGQDLSPEFHRDHCPHPVPEGRREAHQRAITRQEQPDRPLHRGVVAIGKLGSAQVGRHLRGHPGAPSGVEPHREHSGGRLHPEPLERQRVEFVAADGGVDVTGSEQQLAHEPCVTLQVGGQRRLLQPAHPVVEVAGGGGDLEGGYVLVQRDPAGVEVVEDPGKSAHGVPHLVRYRTQGVGEGGSPATACGRHQRQDNE